MAATLVEPRLSRLAGLFIGCCPAPRFTHYLLWMLLRWYRSRSFLIGLMGLVMLAGSFAFYARTYAAVQWDSPDQAFSVSKGRDVIGISYARYRGFNLDMRSTYSTGFTFTGYDFGREVPVGQFFRPMWYLHEDNNDGTVIRNLFISQWFVVLIYFLAWLAGMVWWHRRKHRLMTASGLLENPSQP